MTHNLNRMKTQELVPAGTICSVTYDTQFWNVIASDDALGNRTTYQHDSFGNLTTMIQANGATSTYAYARNRIDKAARQHHRSHPKGHPIQLRLVRPAQNRHRPKESGHHLQL